MYTNTEINELKIIKGGDKMDFLSIDELITRYKKRVKKAEQLNTTDNKYYAEKKSIIHWLYVLKSYINPSYALTQSQLNITNVYNDILFNSIEKAIGEPLNAWQREYIITGKNKIDNEVLVITLRQLLDNTAKPMELNPKAIQSYFDVELNDNQKECYADFVLVMHNLLESAGIPVRQVLT